jgi:hypothetical protein
MWGNEEELHVIAGKLGLKRAWFQTDGLVNHYDLTLKKRERAVQLGVKEVNHPEMFTWK